jgi:hypothetical protein
MLKNLSKILFLREIHSGSAAMRQPKMFRFFAQTGIIAYKEVVEE